MMNKMIDFNNLTHDDVQQLLSAEEGDLTSVERSKLEQHIASCDQCADFAATVSLLKDSVAIAYPEQLITLQEKAEIISKIDSHLAGVAPSSSASRQLNLLGSAVVALVAILIFGAFIFTLNRPQNGVEVVSESNVTRELGYDGWEMGVAFDIPDVWPVQQLLVDEIGGDGVVLSMGENIYDLNEAFPPNLAQNETFGFVLVDNPDFKWPGNYQEQLEQFHQAGMGESGRYFEIAGRHVLVTETEVNAGELDGTIYIVAGSLQVAGRFVRVNTFGRFDNREEASEILMPLLSEIVASTEPVDYAGWEEWSHPEQGFQLAYPDQLKLSDSNGDTVIVEHVVPDFPFRFLIEYDRPTATSQTLAERQVILLSGFGGPHLVVEEPWSPAHRPDLLFGRYDLPQADGMSLLTGVLKNPNVESDQPFIASFLLIDEEQIDVYQSQFEQMMRSLRWQNIPLMPANPIGHSDDQIRVDVVHELKLPDGVTGSGLALNWVEFNGMDFHSGDEIVLDFDWTIVKPIDRAYNLFIHLLSSEGELVAQLDSEPIKNAKPTFTWPLWAFSSGQHILQIPEGLAAGDYRLVAGHYDVESGGRLQINGSDRLDLGQIVIGDPESADSLTENETLDDAKQHYDGWELGIAFDMPAEFGNEDQVIYQEWRDGRAIMMGQDFAKFSASSVLDLAEGEMAGLVFVADNMVDDSKPADEQLREFHTGRVGETVSLELAGKPVLVSKGEAIEGGLLIYEVDVSLIFNGRLVQLYGIGNFGGRDDSGPIVRNLVEILNSMEPVDYADWWQTTHPTERVHFLRPNFIQQVRQLGNTTIYAEAESNPEPFLLYVEYGEMTRSDGELQGQIDRFLADYGESMLAESLTPPLGRSDLVLQRYDFVQADDVTLFVGALEKQNAISDQPYVVTALYISKDEIDRYRPLFEQILRSMRW